MRKHLNKLFLIAIASVAIAGCETSSESVEHKMQEIRNKPPLPVEPPPPYVPVPSYAYDGYKYKSPFLPTSIAKELTLMAGKRVYPNLSRVRDELESFDLEDLRMKGVMRGNGVAALVQTPLGEVKQVRIGNYMGKNFGRVIRITDNQIDLLEVVPNGQDGYIERPRTLILRTDS